MKALDFNDEIIRGMDVVLVNKKPYLFTNMRISRESIPKGWFAYDVRESDGGAGDFSTIQKLVLVNHWGTIIGKDEVPMDPEFGCYFCEDPDDGNFIYNSINCVDEFEVVIKEMLNKEE